MDNTQFDYNSGIWIDSCPESHGIWLDAGELHLVREHRRNLQGELTAGEKAKISAALLDGRSTTMRNRLDILGEIAASRREHGGEY
jgi:Zn-finger nucleic acid-binding protein